MSPMKAKVVFLILFILFEALVLRDAHAIECDGNKPSDTEQLNQYIDACRNKVNELEGQKQSLKASIEALDSKIHLAQAQIAQTNAQIFSLEKDVVALTTVVSDLNQNLTKLSAVYLSRIRASYMRRDLDPITLFFSSDSFAKFLTRIRYAAIVKARDQLVISEMETARQNYDTQKQAKIVKQKQVQDLKIKLVAQQTNLSNQQKEKNVLLVITQNSEDNYNKLKQEAESDFAAINAIIAGGGQETPPVLVNQKDVVANIEPIRPKGDYCNSTGPHLHLTVLEGDQDVNPFNYLKPVSYVNNTMEYPSRDPFNPNPNGDWDWPINGAIFFNQGYGVTSLINFMRNNSGSWLYDRHNGIDITGSSTEIHAIKSGQLIQGIYPGKRYDPLKRWTDSNGVDHLGGFSDIDCNLQYVKVKHQDSNIVTLYIHVGF